MSPTTRKRRRSQAFPDDPQNQHIDAAEHIDNDTETVAIANLEKEAEIWDAFREEHYEGIYYPTSSGSVGSSTFQLSNNCP
jgi:hypothetical protein